MHAATFSALVTLAAQAASDFSTLLNLTPQAAPDHSAPCIDIVGQPFLANTVQREASQHGSTVNAQLKTLCIYFLFI